MAEALGYKNRTEAAIALRSQGLRASEIGRMLGITPNAVTGLISSRERHRVRGGETPASRLPTGAIILPIDVRIALRPAAAKRGVSVEQLILDLAATIAEDDLTDAILDDGKAGA